MSCWSSAWQRNFQKWRAAAIMVLRSAWQMGKTPCVLIVFHDNYCLAIRRRDGATIEWNGFEGKSILVSLRWDSACQPCRTVLSQWVVLSKQALRSTADRYRRQIRLARLTQRVFRYHLAFQHPSECQSSALQGPRPAACVITYPCVSGFLTSAP